MNQDSPRTRPSIHSPVDVSLTTFHSTVPPIRTPDSEVASLLKHLIVGQDRQNQLLEELVNQVSSNHRQRQSELGQWKQANPRLARNCHQAAEKLGKVQTEFLKGLTQEIGENFENLIEGEFMLNEFVDRFGPRMAHLNGLLQVLSQLGSGTNSQNSAKTP